ncbi:hypothetical protein [Micromonospora sp. NPDC048898]|uniref:hypothetical protein n=1 Tax=Micromonospora sp. NPDC048898 TaxID=3364260 RepID=UPI0037162AE7
MLPSYSIVPGVGVPGAHFGEMRAIHQARLGSRTSFERVPGSGVVDAYFDVTLMLSYDEEDRLREIEIGGADTFVEGVQLLDRPLSEVIDDLRRSAINPEFVADLAFELPGLGIYLMTPAPEELEVPVESVSIRPLNSIKGSVQA